MKFLTAVVIIGIVIWYIDFMSPEKRKKRKEKFDAFTKGYEEKIARSNLMAETIGNISTIVISIGLLSAVVDNVPLVAATQGMYDLAQYPTDHFFWEFLAYCAGTGGSALIIGSAAGVAAMGMEKITFFWYLKKMSWLALIGFFSGALIYILQDMILH